MLTCMPLGLMTSKAPVMLLTNWMTLLKLSSPILQEPSMRKTRSALAPLHTVVQEQEINVKHLRIILLAHKWQSSPHHPMQGGLLLEQEGWEVQLALRLV